MGRYRTILLVTKKAILSLLIVVVMLISVLTYRVSKRNIVGIDTYFLHRSN